VVTAVNSAFVKDLVRSVHGSLGRFLAIMGISALGCGFFAGLQMSGPDMRAAGDAFYDGTSLYDIRLVSTLGFSDEDVERVGAVDGAGPTMPAITCDVMAKMGHDRLAVRISSLDVEAAENSEPVSDYAVASNDEDYLNRLMLREGRWPSAAGECVITADKDYPVGFGVGDVVEVLYGTQDVDELLATRRFTVVGRVSASYYPYTGSFGSTSLGSGMIGQYLYVTRASFAEDVPFTEIYVRVPEALELTSGSEAYEEVVGTVKARYEDQAQELAAERLADVKADAQETLDEKRAEYLEERADAERQLDDAAAELAEAADKLADGARELEDGESQYESGLAEYEQGRIEADDKLADGQRQLDEGREKLESSAAEIADGERQLEEGERELAAGQRKADEGARELAQGEQELADAEKKLDDAERQLDEGEAQLKDAQKQLDEAEQQLGMTQEDIDAKRAELEAGEAEWASQREQLVEADAELATCVDALQAVSGLVGGDGEPTQEEIDAVAAQVQAGIEAAQALYGSGLIDFEDEAVASQVEALLAQIQADLGDIEIDENTDPAELLEQLSDSLPGAIDDVVAAAEGAGAQIEDGVAQGDAALEEARALLDQAQEARDAIDAGRAEIAERSKELEAGRREVEEGRAELEAGKRELDDAREELARGADELEKGRAELEENRAKLENGKRQLEDGRASWEQGVRELAEAREEAERQLAEARAQLDDALAELESGRAELLDGYAEYEDGLAEYTKARAEADEKFADAEAQLADAQREIDELEVPDIYALDRSQSEGAVTYNDDTLRIDSIADVFPFIFFLVAALVSLTTMTRMVEDDRILIGTYKALGYSTGKIAAKYLAYAGVAGAVGATAGILVLSQVLPYIVISSYAIIYSVPVHSFPMPINVGIALVSGGLGVGVTLFATWFAVVSSLRETPATLMLPRAPKAGKRILLEHIGPIWSRLSFSWKVTCRNIFRYKRRLAMTAIGISGCTALLLTGFGLHDAIWDIIDNQYGPIVHYDTTIGLDDNAIVLDADRVEAYLDGREGVSGLARMQQENMQAGAPGYDGALMRVGVIIPRSAEELEQSLTLRNRVGRFGIDFDENSVVVTEKLSMKLGVDVGDEVLLFDQDVVGNAIGSGHALTVTGVAENYVGNAVYVGRGAWKTVDAVPPVFQTIYASVSPEGDVRQELSDDLQDMDDVSTVIFSDETINLYRNMLKVVDLIVVVLIVSAAALAFIVLYNLTNINVSERVREIASLKVLGFTRGEVYAYIFREIALLAVAGDAAGMLLGTWLAQFVITTAEVDYVMFGRTIHPPSYGYAFVLTLVFTGLVILFMRKKLDRVNMVESLKSVD